MPLCRFYGKQSKTGGRETGGEGEVPRHSDFETMLW